MDDGLIHGQEYRAGTLSTVEMKDACIAKLQEIVAEFQKVSIALSYPLRLRVLTRQNRAQVTDELVSQFTDSTRRIDPRLPSRAAATA